MKAKITVGNRQRFFIGKLAIHRFLHVLQAGVGELQSEIARAGFPVRYAHAHEPFAVAALLGRVRRWERTIQKWIRLFVPGNRGVVIAAPHRVQRTQAVIEPAHAECVFRRFPTSLSAGFEIRYG